jgi:hypothetical protein
MSKLYLYSDFTTAKWAKNPQHWRELTGKSGNPLRCAHQGVDCPPHYHKPNGHLANDAIERMPTMKDLINALTP